MWSKMHCVSSGIQDQILLLLDIILSLKNCESSQKWQQPVPVHFGHSEKFFIEMYFCGQWIKEPTMNSPTFWEQNQIWRVYLWLQRQQVVTSVKMFGTG